jgi:ATP-dependent Clp protease ATP-binding subunit ClpA
MWLLRLLRTEPTRPPVPLTGDGWLMFDAAVRVARRNRHKYVSTNHLLIGISEAGPTLAGEALERAGITSAAIRQHSRPDPGLGQANGPLPFTRTPGRVFAAALRDAERTGATEVNSLGLLLVLARDEDGVARELLARVVAAEAEPFAAPEPSGM